MADREPVVLNGRYELHARIARGGMAEVFLARDQVLDRSVAVKVLFPEFATDPAFVERFRREAQSAANLTHPAIVGVYDWGSYRGTYFIVMEYVRGRSLAEILRAEGTLHPDRAADIATDIAGALYFAHRNGVVHRDIKPGNVLITPQGHVKVTDFGIARAVGGGNTDNLTQAGSVMGTASYFSPEQAQGLAVDPRSDLYSLGVVLYEMVCGHPPFTGDSPVAIAYQHVQATPTPPRQVDPAIPQSLEAITLKLLAKNPANRYATAEELRADLRRYREGQPVLAESVLAGPAVVGAAAVAAVGAGTPGELTNVLPPTVVGPAAGGMPPGTDPTALGPSYTGAPNYEPPRRNGVFIAVLVVLLALLGVLLFFFARTVLGDEGGATQVTVPNVVGTQREEAEATLAAQGLKAAPQFQASATVEPNRVISQQPAANATADKDSTVVDRRQPAGGHRGGAERGGPDRGAGPLLAHPGRLHQHQPLHPGRPGHHQEGPRHQSEPRRRDERAEGSGHPAGGRDRSRPGDAARRRGPALRPGRQRAGGVRHQCRQHRARRPDLPAAGRRQRHRDPAVRHGADQPEAAGAGLERSAHGDGAVGREPHPGGRRAATAVGRLRGQRHFDRAQGGRSRHRSGGGAGSGGG